MAERNAAAAAVAAAAEPGGADVLDAVRRNAQELLESLPTRPSALRVRAGEIAVELEWPAVEYLEAMPPMAAPLPAAPPALTVVSGGAASDTDLHQICAPTVGVFYRAPEPGQPPFVREGDLVEVGQQVAILEAMKIMVPVEADRGGRVVAVTKENGAQVEYGEALFTLEPVD